MALNKLRKSTTRPLIVQENLSSGNAEWRQIRTLAQRSSQNDIETDKDFGDEFFRK